MLHTRRWLMLLMLAFASWLSASAASAQTAVDGYGPGDQVLAVGAVEFRPASSSVANVIAANGYLYSLSLHPYLAPLRLPEGAEIFQVCLYVDDPGQDSAVSLQVQAVRLAPAGQPAGISDVSPLLVANFDIGLGVVCTDPFSYTFHTTGDVDGDGTAEHVTHWLNAGMNGNAGLGGVRVLWRRQVSPAPATPTFGDVPVSDPAFQFVEALVASGVTAGCGGGSYCPDAPLTRRQMAVFLAKALGLHWPL